jgi:hypothetical protein
MDEDKVAGDIASLLRERDGYVRRGLSNRVAQVDAQLALLGHATPVEVERSAPSQPETPERKTRRKA